MRDSAIRATGLRKSYGDQAAVRAVSLDIEELVGQAAHFVEAKKCFYMNFTYV